MRRSAIILSVLLTVAAAGASQTSSGITLEPRSSVSVEVPGPVDNLYRSGFSASSGVRFSLTRASWLGLALDLRFTELALTTGNRFDLSWIAPEAGVDFRFAPLDWLAFEVRLAGGAGLAWTQTDVLPYSDRFAAGPTIRWGAGLVFTLGRLTLRAGADEHSFLGLASSIGVGLRGGWSIGGPGFSERRAEQLESQQQLLDGGTERGGRPSLEQITIPPIFPVMRKYYSENAIGSVVLVNNSEAPVDDVLVTIDMPGFIDTALPSARFDTLSPGQSEVVDLLAIFNEQVLSITESERVPATISVQYTSGGNVSRVEEVVPVEFHDRNTLTWDDDRKVAMFVTARDPEVKLWAGNLSAVVSNEGNTAVDPHLQHAMMMHTAISEAGLAYGPDPATPYAKISEDPFALDYVQFPFQTLTVKTGDCDDLSVLYASLLEAAGQATAFVLTPGHIFVAVRLDVEPGEAAQHYRAAEDLIVQNEQVWLPIEVTLVREGFLEAWSDGAREWRENVGRGDAQLIPLSDAWQVYPSVAFAVTRGQFVPPDISEIEQAFDVQVRQFVLREISARAEELRRRIETDPHDPRSYNQLGVLYARYGLFVEAREAFTAPATLDHPPTLTNLGNLAFLSGDFGEARQYYDRALELESESPAALLGLARVHHELENYGFVREYYERLTRLHPGIASRYSYLGPGGEGTERASGASELRSTVEWEEEQ